MIICGSRMGDWTTLSPRYIPSDQIMTIPSWNIYIAHLLEYSFRVFKINIGIIISTSNLYRLHLSTRSGRYLRGPWFKISLETKFFKRNLYSVIEDVGRLLQCFLEIPFYQSHIPYENEILVCCKRTRNHLNIVRKTWHLGLFCQWEAGLPWQVFLKL